MERDLRGHRHRPVNQRLHRGRLEVHLARRSAVDASEIAAGVREFCGDVDEFWAWIPTFESFAEWSNLGSDAPDIYAKYWDWDLQLLQSLVDPWPDSWPDRLHDLNAAAVEAGVDLPPRQANHLAPDVHAVWNRHLFERILHARQG